MIYLWVALGGALGSVSRFWLSNLVLKQAGTAFPYGTLAVNLIGSFAIGVAWSLLVQQQWGTDHYRPLVIAGFLGGFTTFSAFSLESIILLQQERWLALCSYVGFSVIGCLVAAAAGIWCSKSLV